MSECKNKDCKNQISFDLSNKEFLELSFPVLALIEFYSDFYNLPKNKVFEKLLIKGIMVVETQDDSFQLL